MIHDLFEKLFGNNHQVKKDSPKSIKHGHQDIQALLACYEQQNQLITAIIMDASCKKIVKLSTGIHCIDGLQNEFQVDEFHPQNVHELLHKTAQVQFSLTQNGVRHQFSCGWLRSETNKLNKTVHSFAFPKGIEQIQLRDAFRIHLYQPTPINVTLTRASKPIVNGTIFDLSSSGMRLQSSGLLYPKPTRGEQFTSIHFVLSDDLPIIGEARLMHWHFDTLQKITYLGLHFEHFDGNTQRTLNRFITDIQRKQRFINQQG